MSKKERRRWKRSLLKLTREMHAPLKEKLEKLLQELKKFETLDELLKELERSKGKFEKFVELVEEVGNRALDYSSNLGMFYIFKFRKGEHLFYFKKDEEGEEIPWLISKKLAEKRRKEKERARYIA
jgi:hypothetical protein